LLFLIYLVHDFSFVNNFFIRSDGTRMMNFHPCLY
jgi:hypothetical protein